MSSARIEEFRNFRDPERSRASQPLIGANPVDSTFGQTINSLFQYTDLRPMWPNKPTFYGLVSHPLKIPSCLFFLTIFELVVFMITAAIWPLKNSPVILQISNEGIITAGAYDGGLVASGQVWRSLTANFLHFTTSHLLGNCLFQVILGVPCESYLGPYRFLFLYVMSGVTGNIFSGAIEAYSVRAGASAACCGIFGIIVAQLFMTWNRILTKARILCEVGFLAVWILLFSLLPSLVDWRGHLGGFIAGFLLAFPVSYKKPLTPRYWIYSAMINTALWITMVAVSMLRIFRII